jgi:hypothetical protein
MGLLDQTISKLDLCPSVKPTSTRALAKIIKLPSSSDVLWAFVYFIYFPLYFSFSLYFVVLAYWVENVNNFIACELRMMSFDRKMLLPMYRIKSV